MPDDLALRLRLARALVVVSFVWPFINTAYFYPDSTVEINFFLVFLAIGLVPEALFDDKWALFLLVPTVGLAAFMGSLEAGLRVVIGVIPLLFLMGLYRLFAARGLELIPRHIAYRALQVFVGFSIIQYINLNVFAIIPDWLTNALTVIIPRYQSTPYDRFGIRGVQGWASEPSAAAMTCFAFAIIAILQDPKRRWRVLLLFGVMTAFNKSIYAFALLALLGLALLLEAKNKVIALSTLIPLGCVAAYFIFHSARALDLQNSIVVYGLSDASNQEFLRVAQIIYPLRAFPGIYKPVELFGFSMEPLGLLPLLVGYGSLIGCLIYYRAIIRRLRLIRASSLILALASAFVLSFVISPDFVPMIVAFAYAVRPGHAAARDTDTARVGWFGRLKALLLQVAGDRRRAAILARS